MNGVKRDGTMIDMLLPPLLLVTTYTTTTSTFPPGLVAGGRAGRPTALVAVGPVGPAICCLAAWEGPRGRQRRLAVKLKKCDYPAGLALS